MPYYQNISLEPIDNPTRINIEPVDDKIEIPKEFEEFKKSIYKDVDILVDVIGPSNDQKIRILNSYIRVAKLAFGDPSRLRYASDQLNDLRQDLVALANETKIRQFTKQIIISGVIIFACGLVLLYFSDKISTAIFAPSTPEEQNVVRAAFYAITGIGAGLLFLAFVRTRYVNYETLANNNVYDYWVAKQIGYVVVITAVIFFAVAVDLIIIGLMGVSLNDIDKRPMLGVTIGFIGVVFPAIYVGFIEKLVPKEK